ncbi:MAG: potassium transporter TrkG [Planctomycetota bacterium]
MKIQYKIASVERWLIIVNSFTGAAVAASFVLLFGFKEPITAPSLLHAVQMLCLFIFIAEKPARFFNSRRKLDYLAANWFEFPLLAALALIYFGSSALFNAQTPADLKKIAIAVYLIIEVVAKVSRTCVNLAASGKNPTRTLILSFIVLIVCGTGLLMLPRSHANSETGFVDSLFTATSATCVTGLVVKSTGNDFSLFGQIVILTLIQLGGLGIVTFGVVFTLLLGQALTVRESVAMQDLLSAQTLGTIGKIIAFIFIATISLEALGAASLFSMWDNSALWSGSVKYQWFYSIFHSISAFCNSGFALLDDSMIGYNKCWQLYGVICPLIILGGLGFPVLYNLNSVVLDRLKCFLQKRANPATIFAHRCPFRIQLQTKIVLAASASLILFGMLMIMLFEYATSPSHSSLTVPDALFQSVTARTAGFNTVKIASLRPQTRFILILLMFIGGSPASTAGGIKTVTFAVVIMAAYAAIRRRSEVEIFRRSIKMVIVGRAITVTLLFVSVLFTLTMALSITERANNFQLADIFFETASALGTVGLSSGITASLTNAGKLLIIAAMLIGKLGPLTLLATLTFNLKPVRFNYPGEPVLVG